MWLEKSMAMGQAAVYKCLCILWNQQSLKEDPQKGTVVAFNEQTTVCICEVIWEDCKQTMTKLPKSSVSHGMCYAILLDDINIGMCLDNLFHKILQKISVKKTSQWTHDWQSVMIQAFWTGLLHTVNCDAATASSFILEAMHMTLEADILNILLRK
jgi:hypothetical protein